MLQAVVAALTYLENMVENFVKGSSEPDKDELARAIRMVQTLLSARLQCHFATGTCLTTELSGMECDALSRHEKLTAIKLYRTRTGAGLLEAKQFIEKMIVEDGFGYKAEESGYVYMFGNEPHDVLQYAERQQVWAKNFQGTVGLVIRRMGISEENATKMVQEFALKTKRGYIDGGEFYWL